MNATFSVRHSYGVGGVSAPREMSLNGILRLRADYSRYHGADPVVEGVGIGPLDPQGRRTAFRYAWQSPLVGDAVKTDVLWIRVISWQ